MAQPLGLAFADTPVGAPPVQRPQARQWAMALPRAGPPSNLGGAMGYLGLQAVRAATNSADSRQAVFAPANLLLAVLDQATPRSSSACPARVSTPPWSRPWRLGAPSNLAVVPMAALCPAGTHDRPPLDELDPTEWDVLTWRRRHGPSPSSS